jgi:hypothetical protein
VEKDGRKLAQFWGVCVLLVTVSPDLAARWLKNNFGNRPLREDTVRAYARDMRNGDWAQTHQGLAFNTEDRLIDGQHRLAAIVRAGKTLELMVTFGLRSKLEGKELTTMDCVDRGATRSVGDQLTIQHGMKYGSITASVCAALAGLCCGERTRRLSVAQTLEVYREFKPDVQFVLENRVKEKGLKASGVLGGFAFAHAADPEVIERYFGELNRGAQPEKYPMLALLRAFLTSDQATLLSRSMDRGLAELVLQAIWLERQGKRVAKLALESEGVEHYRRLLAARVEKVAALFRLPEPGTVGGERTSAPGALPSAPSHPQPKRPALEAILAAVEFRSKIGRIVLQGRGQEGEIASARMVFVTLARGYGHTAEAIGPLIKRQPESVAALVLPASAMTVKERKLLEAVKERLARS